jgi:hypothetical protein
MVRSNQVTISRSRSTPTTFTTEPRTMTTLVRRTTAIGGVALLLALAAVGTIRATAPTSAALGPATVSPAAIAAAPTANTSDTSAAGDALGADVFGTDLDALLAADQSTAATTPTGKVARAALARGPLRRLAAAQRLVHATVVVDLKQGGLTTIQLDHGTIATVRATSVTISEAGGGSVTVTLGDGTRVRRNGAKATVADLKSADEVFVMSKVEAGGTTAYLVVVPKA